MRVNPSPAIGTSKSALKVLVILLCLTGIAIAEDVLSVEFLDYLAEFEGNDGGWIDPMELEMMAQLGEDSDDAHVQSNASSEVGIDE